MSNNLPVAAEPSSVELAERQFALIQQQANVLANSGIVPAAYRKKPDDIMAAALYGASFGWSTTTSLSNIDVIEGKPSLATAAKVGLVHRAGHQLTGDVTTTEAVATGRRADTGAEMTVRYTLDDAKLAGLANKSNWKRHPKAMLWARAVSTLCKRLFPDVELGSYVEDELSDDAQGVRSAPVWDDEHESITPELDGPAITMRDVLNLFEEVDPRAQEDIEHKIRSRYGRRHPEIGAGGIYAIPDNLLPSTEVDKLYEFIGTFAGSTRGDEPKLDTKAEVVDAEIVDSEDPTTWSEDGGYIREADPAGDPGPQYPDGEPF